MNDEFYFCDNWAPLLPTLQNQEESLDRNASQEAEDSGPKVKAI